MQKLMTDEGIEYLCVRDSIFRWIRDNYGLPPNWKRNPGFESLVKIILEQQVSLNAAKVAYEKLKSICCEIDPLKILQLSDKQMRDAYISRQKANYIRELSKAILEGKFCFEELLSLDPSKVYDKLTSIKGIGPWTANVYMIFCLQYPDIFPEGDVALINTIKELKEDIEPDKFDDLIKTWSPYRTTAAFFLWHYYLSKRGRKALI